MKYLLNLFIILLLASCLPEQQIRTGNELDGSVSNDTGNDQDSDSSLFGIDTAWLNSGITNKALTLDVDNTKTVYLIGDKVHNYLVNTNYFTSQYCLEIRFPQTSNTKPNRLRVKATPTYSNNFSIGQTARFFIINLSTDLGNNFCNKDSQEVINGQKIMIQAGDSNFDGIVNAADTNLVYKTQDVCTNCLNILTAQEVILYQVDTNATNTTSDDYLKRVNPSSLNYSDLVFRIDTNSNSDSGNSSCTNSACQAQGYDCCVNGQCINEKALKISGINADPSGFAIAEQEKLTNATWYKKYPQFYYACLETPPSDNDNSSPNEPEDPVSDAEQRLTQLVADYECVKELEQNSLSDPFHKNPINGSASYTKCDITNSAQKLYYKSVMKRLYENCGCSETSDLTSMISNCPAYNYSPLYQTDSNGNSTGVITSIQCVTPEVEQTPLPFQDLEVNINSRSAPHRFFDKNNFEIDPTQPLPTGASGIQEGEEFKYLDNAYIFPRNGVFNMNSILGQMTLNLDQARPAYQIDIEYDKQYLISTRSGYYQACPTCAKDSWFNNFSAFPASQYGVGIQPVGFTTKRDTYATNLTLGNYEDTIFSRACFIPPTMIPYGHNENNDVQQQRLNRLKTQAALFANGYQRDWYGFNKGALIGSFDGVTWFAVGKGRIVKSTTDKLFLAINAPFADLASPTNHIVSIQEYDFSSSAAVYDYDPTKAINDSEQNEAGSCQEWHQCETDSHCISKLGWEYVCADVTGQKTKWPKFEVKNAQEIANTSKEGSLVEFLQQRELPPSSGTKRCVYRGAGAPCRVDYENISDEQLRKNLTCAPNFYCAQVDTAQAFNTEIARFGKPLDELVISKNHFFGQDANILGRPRHYLSTGNLSKLDTTIANQINANLSLNDPAGTGKFGLCRPGKLLPSYNTSTVTKDWRPSDQHKRADNKYRTDYTSQIGACNSTLYTDLRYSSCPALDEDGNHIYTQDDFLNDNFLVPEINIPQGQQAVIERYSFAQNACGMEALRDDTPLSFNTTGVQIKNYSAFKTIEGDPLNEATSLLTRTIARNSCLRKAGSVCHTDLDCSPNKLQASVIDLVSESYFGNAAEKKYYEEYLICGQATSEPNVTDPNFATYNIHNNRCCRPVGETLTMYTEDSQAALESQGINTSLYGALNPTSKQRYSRYSVVDSSIDSFTKESNIIRPSANTDDMDNNKVLDNSVNITNPNQWKTIHTAAAKTCCGGSWVRAFDDGTNNWRRNRLNIDPSNFKCLNYRNGLYLTENASAYNMSQTTLDQGKADFCFDGSLEQGGCVQRSLGTIENFSIRKPTLNTDTGGSGVMYLSSSLSTMENLWENYLFTFGRFIPYDGSSLNDRGYVLQWSDDPDPNNITRKNLITLLPSFVTYDNEVELQIRLTDPNPTPGATTNPQGEILCSPATLGADPTGGLDSQDADWDPGVCPDSGPGERNCCYILDPITRVLRVAFSNTDKNDATNYDNIDSELRINFTAVGTLEWEQKKASATTVNDINFLDHRRSSSPGNALYYLKKLAKLEYLGIPQMVYEPLYCNDIYQKMVPGIFKEEAFGQKLLTVMDFLNHDRTFYDSSLDTPWNNDTAPAPHNANALNQNLVATQELIEHSPIFSDNQFKCCLELGTVIDINSNDSLCCSGVAVEDEADNTKKICKLPTGTNLNVYFNKFVSGEGLSSSLNTPLSESDFDIKTGEPKLSNDVLNKLVSLGERFCETGEIRRGSAFGNYQAQPVAPSGSRGITLFSIVDHITDSESGSGDENGFNAFQSGFRWDHHIYCKE
ncbi:MAG: hypothetical protein QF441_01275 [Bacteriovoracaceae bacterium]|nr:hypothetical protein [Halobacteriovoraceae bacterium]MDP7319202.1 hypothetical protein [Bacteriovoracaceae bacterium]